VTLPVVIVSFNACVQPWRGLHRYLSESGKLIFSFHDQPHTRSETKPPAEDKINMKCYLLSDSGGSDELVWSNGGIMINRAKLKKLGCLTSEKNLVCMHVHAISLQYLWIYQSHLFPSALYINYIVLVPSFWPSLGVYIWHCLHFTPLYIGQCEYECAHLMMAKRPKQIIDN
jgi:hypothetical protein